MLNSRTIQASAMLAAVVLIVSHPTATSGASKEAVKSRVMVVRVLKSVT